MPSKSLIPPTINNNGTSADALIAQQRDVLKAIDQLQAAMANATPHGRDYQTRPPGTDTAAREAWLQRMQIVALLRLDVVEMAEAVVRQVVNRGVKAS